MPRYLTPGVYFEKVDEYRKGIAKIRTDIAGFVGIAQKGPLNKPVRLESWKQFQAVFGDCIPQAYLAYAVHGFFENEGKICFVVRIADLNKAGKARINIMARPMRFCNSGQPGYLSPPLRVMPGQMPAP